MTASLPLYIKNNDTVCVIMMGFKHKDVGNVEKLFVVTDNI